MKLSRSDFEMQRFESRHLVGSPTLLPIFRGNWRPCPWEEPAVRPTITVLSQAIAEALQSNLGRLNPKKARPFLLSAQRQIRYA
jgi:hypothetical protein